MPLNQSGILNGRRIYAQDVSDLYDLLTGVMTDQPVTLADGLTVIGTFQATSSVFQASDSTVVALIAQGTQGQTADIFQVKSYSGGSYFRVDAGGTVWAGTAQVLSGSIAPFAYTVQSKTSTYTANIQEMVLADATAGSFTVNLPTAVGVAGRSIIIKKTDSSANAVTADGNGSETIDGAATLALPIQNISYTLTSDNANWRIT